MTRRFPRNDQARSSVAPRREITHQCSHGYAAQNQRARDDESYGHVLAKERDAAERGKNRDQELHHRRLGCCQAFQRFIPKNVT